MRELKCQSESRRVNQPLILLQYPGTSHMHQYYKDILFNSLFVKKKKKKDIQLSFYLHTVMKIWPTEVSLTVNNFIF